MNKIYYYLPSILQNLAISTGKYRENSIYQRYRNKIYHELDISESYTLNELKEMQNIKLRQLIEESYNNIPFYRKIMKERRLKPEDIKSTDDLIKMPILKKDIVRDNMQNMINRNYSKFFTYLSHTTGTTGVPLHYYMDSYTNSFYWAHAMRHRKWHGMKMYNEWCASLGGRRIIKNEKDPLWRYDWPDKLIIYSSHHLNERNSIKYYEHMKRRGLKYIKGYSANIFTFASYLYKNNLVLPMKKVFIGAEPVQDFMKPVIKKVFQTDIGDFYGNSEETARAYDCPEHNGLHMAMESIYMEICDSEGNKVKDGEYGEIVGTNLTNFYMPLIRYKTGDTSRIIDRKCNCGRSHILIKPVKAREYDRIESISGKTISPTQLVFPFYELKAGGVERSQIIQNEPGHIDVLIQKGNNYEQSQMDFLKGEFYKLFGDDLIVHIKYEEIPFEPGKKFRWVERRTPSEER